MKEVYEFSIGILYRYMAHLYEITGLPDFQISRVVANFRIQFEYRFIVQYDPFNSILTEHMQTFTGQVNTSILEKFIEEQFNFRSAVVQAQFLDLCDGNLI